MSLDRDGPIADATYRPPSIWPLAETSFSHPLPRSGSPAEQPEAVNFFVPSYLLGSSYGEKLQAAHQAKLLAQKRHRAAPNLQLGLGSSMSVRGQAGAHCKSGLIHDALHTLPERTSPNDRDESIPPLPSRWNKDDSWGGIQVQADGLEAHYTPERSQSEQVHEAFAIRTDHPIPVQCGIYYFEVTIMPGRRDECATVGIGVSSRAVSLSRQPGWEPESWAYHGDDGWVYVCSSMGIPYGPSFHAGDVVGCGVNFFQKTVFFTRNGNHLGVAASNVGGKLYPSVGLKKSGEAIRVNFGQQPFIYNIDQLVEAERMRLQHNVMMTSIQSVTDQKARTSQLTRGRNESEFIQDLVLQFLQHDGYVETAKAFSDEIYQQKTALNLDPKTVVKAPSVRNDKDAHNRLLIRRAILDGDVETALKHTMDMYPDVLRHNSQIYFRLRCRRFIEMVRKAAELNQGARGSGAGHLAQEPPERDPQAMDLDSQGTDSHGGANGGSGDRLPWDQMDTEENVDGGPDLERQILQYGQGLHAEFRDDRRLEVINVLGDIWSLLAYPDPLKEPQVAHLLDRKGRLAVAEELNGAILISLGNSPRSRLETLYGQTSVLLEDLRSRGTAATLLSLQSLFDELPRDTAN